MYMDIYKSSSEFIYLTKPYFAISVYFYINVFIKYSTLSLGPHCAYFHM